MKLIYLLSTLITILFLSSCTTKEAKQEAQEETTQEAQDKKKEETKGWKKEPEQLGRIAFEILKNISTESRQEYLSHFASIEDIRELGRNEAITTDQKFRNKMTSITKEEWEKEMLKDYNQTKERAATLLINWQEIDYLDFVYEIENKEGIEALKGKLYFKSNNKSYNVEILTIWNGKEYLILRLWDLSK